MAPRPDEFSLIANLFAPLAANVPGAFGLKDDAAAITPDPGMDLVLTVDALVEGVHFLPTDPASSIARKLLRVNLSDLAAKGATPLGYLLTTAWRPDTSYEWISDFAAGLAEDQSHFGVSLWGGDTVSTPGPLSFTLTAIGQVPSGRMLRRASANVGDMVFLTGTLGDAALGLAVSQGRLTASSMDEAALVARYRVPEPRVGIGPRLVGLAHAALDVSDGLMADLGHLCEASSVGARIDVSALPLSAMATRCLMRDPALIESILTGGDDYEILFTTPAGDAGLIASLAADSDVHITRIGTIVDAAEGVSAIAASGEPMRLSHPGFRHF